jgi:hypothetical protein
MDAKGRRSKSNGHKNIEQDNSCIAFCRYGEQSGIKSQTVRIYPDHPTLESGPSALHQNTSDDTPTPMEEDNTKENNLLEDDLVDYRATPEQGIDVNVIIFSTNCTIIGDYEPVVAQFNFGPKEVAFTEPKELVNHLKPFFVCAVISMEYRLLKYW